MWTKLVDAFLAVLAFVSFPFLVITAVAGLLGLMDRFAYLLRHHGHPHNGG